MTSLTQNFLNPNNKPLVLGEFTIRQDEDGRYCINDLHKASGGLAKHKPSNFIRNQQTQDLIVEIERSANLQSSDFDRCSNMSIGQKAVNIIKGGVKQGMYVVKEIVYAYAMWISPKFHLMVIRAYDAMVMQNFNQQDNSCKSTPKDREGLRHAVSNLVSRARINFSDAYIMVGQRFNVKSIEEIPLSDLGNAVEYVHGLILTFDKAQQYSPINIDAIQDCCGVLQYRLIEYHTKLEDEVKRLGGKMPEYPSYNPEEVAQALMTRILQGKQMVLNLNFQGGFTLNLVPRDAVMVDSKNIPELVSRTDLVAKEQLPLIMQNAMDRLVK